MLQLANQLDVYAFTTISSDAIIIDQTKEGTMEELILKLIDINDKERVLDFIKEMVSNGNIISGVWYENEETFEKMLAQLKKHEQTKFESYEQETAANFQYLLIRKHDNKLVGMFSIRPYLTRKLDESFGGNIGYSIRPTERLKGYATEGLKLAIEKFKEINKKDGIMLCCNKDNVGSRKAIIKNGGKLIEEKQAIISKQKYMI